MHENTELYRQLWLKAYREGTVRLELESEREAKRVRFSLYNAVKSFRNKPHTELGKAIAECRIQFENEKTLEILHYSSTSTGAAIAKALGDFKGKVKEEPEFDEVAFAAEQSLKRLQEKLSDEPVPVTGPRVTPYYTRES